MSVCFRVTLRLAQMTHCGLFQPDLSWGSVCGQIWPWLSMISPSQQHLLHPSKVGCELPPCTHHKGHHQHPQALKPGLDTHTQRGSGVPGAPQLIQTLHNLSQGATKIHENTPSTFLNICSRGNAFKYPAPSFLSWKLLWQMEPQVIN